MKHRLMVVLMAVWVMSSWIALGGVNPQITEAFLNIEGVDDSIEESQGGFVALGSRKAITCWVNVAGRVSLSWTSANIKVYDSEASTTPLSSPVQYDAGATPRVFHVEGVTASSGLAMETLLFEALHTAPYPHDIGALTVPDVQIVAPACRNVGVGSSVAIVACVEPEALGSLLEWRIEGEALGSTITRNEDGLSALFCAGNNNGNVKVIAGHGGVFDSIELKNVGEHHVLIAELDMVNLGDPDFAGDFGKTSAWYTKVGDCAPYFKSNNWFAEMGVVQGRYKSGVNPKDLIPLTAPDQLSATTYQQALLDMRRLLSGGMFSPQVYIALPVVAAHEDWHVFEWRTILDSRLLEMECFLENQLGPVSVPWIHCIAHSELQAKDFLIGFGNEEVLKPLTDVYSAEWLNLGEAGAIAAQQTVWLELYNSIVSYANDHGWQTPP